MTLTKYKTYFALQGLFLLGILMYQSPWLFSNTTVGIIKEFGYAPYLRGRKTIELMNVDYLVNDKLYNRTYTRNATPDSQQNIIIRYLTFMPGASRIDTPVGEWEEPLLWYVVFFIFTSMMFFIPNDTTPKDMLVTISNKKPWVTFSNKK
jgi:hypothetical protein